MKPEIEKGLIARASELGLTPDTYFYNLVRKEAALISGPRLSGKEKAQAFVEWAKSHRPTKLLLDEDISRETMYSDRT